MHKTQYMAKRLIFRRLCNSIFNKEGTLVAASNNDGGEETGRGGKSGFKSWALALES